MTVATSRTYQGQKKDKRESQAPTELEAWQEPGWTFHTHTHCGETQTETAVCV